jgi:hypothetical protein
MIFKLQRLYHNEKFTISFLISDDNLYRSFVCEDTFRAVKVAGETRIPAGFYPLGIRKEDTPLTIKHRNNPAYKAWGFKYHIEILNIPNFKGVYVHSGSSAEDTEGCITPGYMFDLTAEVQQGKSMISVRDFYAIVYPKLEADEKVFLQIEDEAKPVTR